VEVTTVGWPDRLAGGCAADFGPLMTVREILASRDDGGLDAAGRGLRDMARYVAEFLTAPHPKLGRAGAVCPFASRGVEEGNIRLTACRIDGHGPEEEARISAAMLGLRSLLAALEAADAEPAYRAIVAVFPALSEPHGSAMIERVQRELKLSFVERRLMIGQFFPSCPEPGLRNPEFRPLQSPVISLAIRNIAISDAPFMLGRQDYVDAYLRIFGPLGVERIEKARLERRPPQCPGARADLAEEL
jgi:hypothetical protein